MTKSAQQRRVQKVGNNVAIEHTYIADDSLLPSPQELKEYKELDPTIITWLLSQTEKEQVHRHETDKKKLQILNRTVSIDVLFVVLCFVLVLVFLALSAFFLYMDKNISGSVFGVLGVVGAYFLGKSVWTNKTA